MINLFYFYVTLIVTLLLFNLVLLTRDLSIITVLHIFQVDQFYLGILQLLIEMRGSYLAPPVELLVIELNSSTECCIGLVTGLGNFMTIALMCE